MNIYIDKILLGKLNVVPETTIYSLKQIIYSWLYKQGINSYNIEVIFNDGIKLAPVIFETNTYDAVNFKEYDDKLKEGIINITTIYKEPPKKNLKKYYIVYDPREKGNTFKFSSANYKDALKWVVDNEILNDYRQIDGHINYKQVYEDLKLNYPIDYNNPTVIEEIDEILANLAYEVVILNGYIEC